jgi:SNF2 family DNA or RNA helicase
LLSPKTKTEDQITKLEEWLLNAADIVVADEAHEIKNDKSLIGGLLAKIKTKSRIATTGSPLSNHLKEYWAMMNWIHPGFLGTLRGFTIDYITPIKEGLYADSIKSQRVLSQTRLVALKKLLEEKLDRRDIRVIQADLPPKTEFVVYTPLAPVQVRLYEGLIDSEHWNRPAGIFKWINILKLICNHPYTLHVPLLIAKQLMPGIFEVSRAVERDN